MFEPLRELLLEDPHALLEDTAVLGEKAGRLFGSRDRAAYAALGGALYAPLRCVNDNVVSWGAAQTRTARGSASSELHYTVRRGARHGSGEDEEAGAAAPSKSADTDAATAASSTAPEDAAAAAAAACEHVPWAPAPHDATTTTAMSRVIAPLLYDGQHRPRGGRRPPLARQLLRAAPHLLPRLAARLMEAVACVLPALRAVFPCAVPRAPRRVQAPPARRAGPEQVTAVTFHPHALWLAVAVDEGSADGTTRVVVHDVTANTPVCVLTHAFQVEVQWMEWKPHARDVLVVGTRGGVLIWSLTAASDSDASGYTLHGGIADGVAHALFYPTRSGFTVTSAAFSHVDANTLACASTADTRLVLLRLSEPPFSPRACGTVVAPSVDGGLGQVLFDDADLFVLCTICEHSSLALLHVERALVAGGGAGATAAMPVALHSRVVPTPAPVLDVVRASGLGPSHYFLRTAGLEGVLLAHINPFIGVEVIAMVSTGLYRGVGGAVTRVACSRRRLWVQTETNHLVVCRYGQREAEVTIIPVGVATSEAVELVAFGGCQTGSLLAMVEADSSISFMPCYHS